MAQLCQDYHFFSICKGSSWNLEVESRPTEFYYLLQQIFGNYRFELTLIEDEDKHSLIIEVTENNIKVREIN